jgi:hypothetical protein
MKNAILAILIIGAAAFGYYIGHESGYKKACIYGCPLPPDAIVGSPIKTIQHHYEFQQHGVSIFRFDLDTGESCWLQLDKEDAQEEDRLTYPMQQCSR